MKLKMLYKVILVLKKTKLNQTMDILNSLPIVIELRQHIEELKKENQDLRDRLLSLQERVNIELEIVEVEKSLDNH